MRGGASLRRTAEEHHRVAVFLWEFTRADATLDASARKALIEQGIADEDRALVLQPEHGGADLQEHPVAAAGQCHERSRRAEAPDRRGGRSAQPGDRGAEGEAGRLPEPCHQYTRGGPRHHSPGFTEPYEQSVARLTPVRVGGNIKTPTKIRDVKPAFPPEAMAAQVQGVVIIEALIGPDGSVENARVLRPIPMLSEAALTAVSQWRFTPTELNGMPVGVIMTVTVNFTLQ